ncbi:MAG: ATP-binding protein [Planctomycetes bacterium]|nr:ATP-binding protein [Planctomycetota bacterium]
MAGGRPVVPRVRHVVIRNYKSISLVSVGLEPFTAIVGPNGAGKSNFIDSLAFVQECLSESIELAFKNRGGIGAVRRRSAGHPTHIGIRLLVELADSLTADYAFQIAAKPTERFTVAWERCAVQRFMRREVEFEVRNGKFTKPIPGIRPRVSEDRLALFAASATDEFRPVYDFLTAMRFYSVVPTRLREPQEPDPGLFLKRHGGNAAAVLKRLVDDGDGGERYERLCRLLSRVVDGLKKVEYRPFGQKETLQFRQDVGLKHPWTFDALNMSDGTLRVLGLLLAVYQPGRPSVVAIEEPEATVHPAVAELVVQVLLDAALERQVLLTTQSADFLDCKGVKESHLRIATTEQGSTLVCPVAGSSREAILQRVYTPGELLRADELVPDVSAAFKASEQAGSPALSRT